MILHQNDSFPPAGRNFFELSKMIMLLGSWYERFVWVHKLVGIATPKLIRTNTRKHTNFKPETMWAPRPGCGFCMPVFIRGVWTPLGGGLCWWFRKTDVLEFRSWCFAWSSPKWFVVFLNELNSTKWFVRQNDPCGLKKPYSPKWFFTKMIHLSSKQIKITIMMLHFSEQRL